MLTNKMLGEITPALLKFKQNMISIKKQTGNHHSHIFSCLCDFSPKT